MKPLLLILLLCFSLSAQTIHLSSGKTIRLGVSSEYDKFSDTTVIKNSQSILPVRPGYVLFDAVASLRGKYEQGITPREVAIIIESRSDGWVFLGQSTALRVLANDSERYSLGEMQRISGDVVGREVVEVLYLAVSLDAIDKLASANELEIQIGPLESEIKPEQRQSTKEWLALFQKPSK